jgi:4-phospho-D-threonate 3-dehydrogenase / 4-phospho-D-erythronate 3-dehydrogenase
MIAITMGDANGIGPELVLKAWQRRELGENFIVVGDRAVLEFCARQLDLPAPLKSIAGATGFEDGMLNVIDQAQLKVEDLQIGRVSERAGRAALAYVESATHLALQGEVEAVVTLPLNKEAVRLSHPGFTGHTEFIAGLCKVGRFTMMLASDRLTVTHVSTHVSLQEAIRRVKRERILEVIRLTNEALSRVTPHPRIAVAGLNPHASEHGSFGIEEEREISPAIADAQAIGIEVVGPEPPDTVFLRAAASSFDAVVCMYHDQGHIPAKLLDFESGVNVTLGLPIIRTSVDHGTAFDIAYKGTASTKSLISAFNYARMLAASNK